MSSLPKPLGQLPLDRKVRIKLKMNYNIISQSVLKLENKNHNLRSATPDRHQPEVEVDRSNKAVSKTWHRTYR